MGVDCAMDNVHEGETVLLVDDEAAIRRVIGAMLARAGYQVVSASDGRDALARVDSGSLEPSITVTDVNMPGMDGIQLTAELSRRFPCMPVLFISGLPLAAAEEGRLPVSRHDCMAKPLDFPTFLCKVKELIEARSWGPSAAAEYRVSGAAR